MHLQGDPVSRPKRVVALTAVRPNRLRPPVGGWCFGLWCLLHPRRHARAKARALRIVADAYESTGQYEKADRLRGWR